MNDNIKVDKSFIESLVEGAAWDAARVTLTEKKATKKKKKKKDVDEDDAKKSVSDPIPGYEAPEGPSDDELEKEGYGKPKESVEVHECPLCESVLEEELSDEAIFEHVAQIQEALKTLEEGTNRPGTPGGSTADLDLDPDEPDDEDEHPDEFDRGDDEEDFDDDGREAKKKKKGTKEAVMSKVKELKAAAKGK